MDQNADLAALRDATPETGRARTSAGPPIDWRTLGPTLAVAIGSLALATWFAVPLLEPVTPVRVATVTAREEAAGTATKAAFNASGWIEPDPYYRAIVPRIGGVIDTLPVVEGDLLVKDETVIAQLDTTRIDRTVAERFAAVRKAEQALMLAQAEHASAQLRLTQNGDARLALLALRTRCARNDAVVEGQREVVASLERSLELNVKARLAVEDWAMMVDRLTFELEQMRAESDALRARVASTDARAVAMRALSDTAETRLLALAAEAELADSRWRADANAVEIASLRKRLAIAQRAHAAAVDGVAYPEELQRLLATQRMELAAIEVDQIGLQREMELAQEVADAPAPLVAARDVAAAMVGMREAELFAAQEAHQTALVEQELHTLRSPIDGRVLEVRARPGMAVGPMGMPGETVVATVFEPTKLLVRVELPLNDVAKVEPGQRVEITCEAAPGRKYRGEVVWLARWANLARNSLPIRVRVLDGDEHLRPEMLTRCRFLPIEREAPAVEAGESRVTRLYVPRDALIRDGETRAVVVFDPQGDRLGEGRARRVSVSVVGDEAAVAADDLIAVEGELSVTHRVVVSAPGSLADGARVRLMEDTP